MPKWKHGSIVELIIFRVQYVTHLYKTSHMSQKHKLSFSYVLKEEKMGIWCKKYLFVIISYKVMLV